MPRDAEKGSFAADIPDDVVAEALRAVEGATRGPAAADLPADHPLAAAPPAAPASEEVAALRARLEEAHELRLRAAADLDNFRKRVAREKDDAQRHGIERLVRDLLPVLDNLDRALAAIPEGPLALGVSMTRRLLEEALVRHGVRSVAAEPGAPFDPNVHQALMVTARGDHPAGSIVEQHQRGYFLHDRLLRPASVVVAAPPQPTVEERVGAAREPGEP